MLATKTFYPIASTNYWIQTTTSDRNEPTILGKGGTGTVFEVHLHRQEYKNAPITIAREFSKPLALKVSTDPVSSEIEEEANVILKKTDSPLFLKLIFAGTISPKRGTEHICFLFPKIHCILDKATPTDLAQVAQITRQGLEAIKFLQDHQIAHLDIKGHNIAITAKEQNNATLKGDVKIQLFDFSAAEVLTDGRKPNFLYPGTPRNNRAPCMIHNSPNDWKQADLWALGCTIYELVAEDHPFVNSLDILLKDKPTLQSTVSHLQFINYIPHPDPESENALTSRIHKQLTESGYDTCNRVSKDPIYSIELQKTDVRKMWAKEHPDAVNPQEKDVLIVATLINRTISRWDPKPVTEIINAI